MAKYYINNITCCFPYGTRQEVPYKYLGVLVDCLGVMGESAMDDIICKIIKNHPIIKDAMWLEFDIDRRTGKYVENYHNIVIKNDNYDENKSSYDFTPIEWR